jgi:hypothetical protein
VIYDDGGSPPLGLRAFSRVVDDERIEMRQRPKAKLRIIVRAERHTSTRQPLQISMFAEMDNRVGAERFSDPKIKR